MRPNTPRTKNKPLVMFHVKWVAQIALSVGLIATVGLLLVIFLATDEKGGSYADIIVSRSLTQQNLSPLMLIFGLLMVAIAAITTWFIALYNSFRIAGPLFRFSQNLKSILENAFAVPIAIRQNDMLHHEWAEFDASQARLREHYAGIREALDQYRRTLPGSPEADATCSSQALDRLREIERRVRL